MPSSLGVCYYPEHWPEDVWPDDARRMAEAGLTYVRIGEFAWSRLEPRRDDFRFDWLERAIGILHAAGLKVILGTPTATPPKWLVDEMPDMLPVDAEGRVRGFGSRRHYAFSHEGYRKECARIVTRLAERFGEHPGVVAWQIDNEYGCHETVLSYGACDRAAFRDWLGRKYQSPDALNRAWGNVFWSMEYAAFDEIELPCGAVTEINPSHAMDFHRFASDMVVAFNAVQTDILRRLSPGRDIVHNFMGRTLSFDHFKLGAELDVSSWDSYPLGFLEDRSDQGDDWKRRFSRAGDPDFQAFHHDLYRATSGGRWWVMEQQPGPVNWAPHNPAPRDGMVRLWSLEAFAHGAEMVSYFRWRQAPFAQEQMHSGLLRPDGAAAEGLEEAARTAADLAKLGQQPASEAAPVALVVDYASAWAWAIQPQGREFDYFRLIFDCYRALRRLGLSIDIISSEVDDLSGHRLVLIPGLFAWTEPLVEAIRGFDGVVLAGPRCGSKTTDFQIPPRLPPALPDELLDCVVTGVESLRGDCPVAVEGGGAFRFWREFTVPGDHASVLIETTEGDPALLAQGRLHYLAGWPDEDLTDRVLRQLCDLAGIETQTLPDGVRLRRQGDRLFAFNYGEAPFDLASLGWRDPLLLGTAMLAPSGVAVKAARPASGSPVQPLFGVP